MGNPSTEYFPVPALEQAEEVLNSSHWAPVELEGIAEGHLVSTQGEVKSVHGHVMRPNYAGGYQAWVRLKGSDGKGRTMRVDKIVLTTFVREAEDGEVPKHKNGDTSDNAVTNLVWAEKETEGARPSAPGSGQSKVGQPKPKTTPRKTPRKKPAPKKVPVAKVKEEVEVLRVYRYRGLQVTVDPDGRMTLPKINLTPEQGFALAKIMARIEEMNRVMGLG